MAGRVSIIIPCYNASEYILCSLDAAAAQTYNDLEIVVVDDGSTDDSVQKIRDRAASDARIRYVCQANAGQSAAINRGVSESTGDYIKLLDADDWIAPDHVAAQVRALSSHSDYVASGRWGYFVDDFRQPRVRAEYTNQDYSDPMEWIVDSLTKDEGMMGGWMWLIPRQVWDRTGGYDSRLSLNNDFHFSIATLLASNGVRFAEGAVYSYRKGQPGALSATYGRKAMESAFLTTQLGIQLLLEREDSDRIRRIAADRFQSWLFQFYPQFPDLVTAAETRIHALGGSLLEMQGGRLLRLLKPIIGWRGVRRLQTIAYRCGWDKKLKDKAKRRLQQFQ